MTRTVIKFSDGYTITNKQIVLSSLKVGDDDLDVDAERTTTGRMVRNRVVIAPFVELELTYLDESTMVQIMSHCRPESFNITFWYPAGGGYYNADVYCPPNYRKPVLFRDTPNIIFDKHTLKFTGMYNMRKVGNV